MTEMEIALLAALVKVLDGYYTPLGHRVKCWKIKGENFFIVSMTNPQFQGEDDVLDFLVPIEHWDKFDIIEVKWNEVPSTIHNTNKLVIERLYKI